MLEIWGCSLSTSAAYTQVFTAITLSGKGLVNKMCERTIPLHVHQELGYLNLNT